MSWYLRMNPSSGNLHPTEAYAVLPALDWLPGGAGVSYFHYLPLGIDRGCNGSRGTFGMWSADRDLKIQQPLSQFFVSQLINLEWVQMGSAEQKLFPASSDVVDDAGHVLVTSYAVLRPDGQWSLMIVNKDQENSHGVRIAFHDSKSGADKFFAGPVSIAMFGSEQYAWHPNLNGGTADPDGPIARSTKTFEPDETFQLPKASVTVLRGRIGVPSSGTTEKIKRETKKKQK